MHIATGRERKALYTELPSYNYLRAEARVLQRSYIENNLRILENLFSKEEIEEKKETPSNVGKIGNITLKDLNLI